MTDDLHWRTIHDLDLTQNPSHLAMAAHKRREYQRKKEYAMHNPGASCSTTIDGADYSAYGLPNFIPKMEYTRTRSMKNPSVGLL